MRVVPIPMPDGTTKRIPQEQAALGQGAERTGRVQAERPEETSGAPLERPVADGTPHQEVPTAVPSAAAPSSTPIKKSLLLQNIEGVLEEDLLELYKALTPSQRKQFKTEGERAARAIERLFKKAAVTVMEIIRLIRRWLRLLPGVNIFFIEKEAKIKAERILALKRKKE